jgi:hypothetical protein
MDAVIYVLPLEEEQISQSKMATGKLRFKANISGLNKHYICYQLAL